MSEGKEEELAAPPPSFAAPAAPEAKRRSRPMSERCRSPGRREPNRAPAGAPEGAIAVVGANAASLAECAQPASFSSRTASYSSCQNHFSSPNAGTSWSSQVALSS